ncbi:RNase III domain-containing protein [Apiospora saccharicola]|uniref:RNase III domain-containing protein n=1 Tax=Apiospora saccharicola TaxID=335842 RepID=A0ABR1TH87_9PEZI
MALNTSRSAAQLARQALQSSTKASSPTILTRPLAAATSTTQQPRSFSSSRRLPQENAQTLFTPQSDQSPRWATTPKRMKAPFSPHITKDPSRSVWHVNESPQKLDDALNNLLGNGGDRLLPDELKWLAVTHKSFDQGRRGFNDRLAFLGKQIATMEAMQGILSSQFPSLAAAASAPSAHPTEGVIGEAVEGLAYEGKGIPEDIYGDRREPFQHAALERTDGLSILQANDIFSLKKLQKLAVETGIAEVVRWKPRKPESLKASGIRPVVGGAIYAIIGAISLQHGGKVASRVVRERVLRKITR